MAAMGRRESVRLLEHAHEAGIRHFDVARLYGYGEAEGALGQFLSGRRDRVTVTTKLGLDPPRKSRWLDLARRSARVAVRMAPPLRRLARRRAAGMVQSGRFDVAAAAASFETSLRELRTDHVDVLLLHECEPHDLSDELLEFLHERVAAGDARAFGVATRPDPTRAILRARPDFAGVVQVANAVTQPGAAGLAGQRALITHSALAGALERVHAHVAGGPDRAARWSDALGVDAADRTALGELMLQWALRANPRGVVLFSSRSPDRIAANAALAGPEPRVHAVEALEQLVRSEVLA
jgi:aryl-alcohol dehydrogenase-like predicted oxidoreductase